MAGHTLPFLRVSKYFCHFARYSQHVIKSEKFTRVAKKGLIMSGIFTGMSKEKKPPEKPPTLEVLRDIKKSRILIELDAEYTAEPDPAKLSREYLIKSAGILASEQACILLTQAALALKQAQKDYSETLFALSVLMEYKLKVLGNSEEEARIWDLILEARDIVNTTRKKKQTLEMIVTNAKTMVNAGAEVAYMTEADLVGSTTGDQLYKIELFLKQSEEECCRAEQKLRDTEQKTVEVEGKYAEEQEEKEKARIAKELEIEESKNLNEAKKLETEEKIKEDKAKDSETEEKYKDEKDEWR